jgi:hypothetical protein
VMTVALRFVIVAVCVCGIVLVIAVLVASY